MAAAIGTVLALAIIAIAIGFIYQVHNDKEKKFSLVPAIFMFVGIAVFFFGMVLDMANQLRL